MGELTRFAEQAVSKLEPRRGEALVRGNLLGHRLQRFGEALCERAVSGERGKWNEIETDGKKNGATCGKPAEGLMFGAEPT